jgi:hypothetical protein
MCKNDFSFTKFRLAREFLIHQFETKVYSVAVARGRPGIGGLKLLPHIELAINLKGQEKHSILYGLLRSDRIVAASRHCDEWHRRDL